MYLIKTPFWLRCIYPTLTWRKLNDTKTIYITFDDGPIPNVTPFVLKTLKEYNAKATFFCIGDNVRKHSDIFRQVADAGHSIGNHTFNHLRGWDTEDQAYLDNFIKCNELTQTKLFRPPHGRIKFSQIARLRSVFPDLQIIMWDVLSGDFDRGLSPEKCLKNVLSTVKPGSIIVFHDSLKAFDRLEYTLPRALKAWQEEGYRFGQL
ncbi:polysaccharide deacetylase family protein [Arcticibacter tournemirensis]